MLLTLAALIAWAHATTPPPRLGFAYFYKPPSDGTPATTLVRHFQLILLTHGDEAYMAELRRDGYRGPILQTLAATSAEGPGPYANHAAACDASYPTYLWTVVDRVGEFCRRLHPHEDWFLHNLRGQRLYSRYQSQNLVWRTFYAMNPASAGWRRFVIARLRQDRKLGFDGYFLDNVDLSRAGLLLNTQDPGGVKEYSNDASYRAAVIGYLAAIHRALPRVPLWANLIHGDYRAGEWTAYLPYLNGVMVEDFALGWKTYGLTPAQQAGQIANIQFALAHGKQVLLVAQGADHDAARRRLTLALAWALLPPRGGLYYRYNDSSLNDYRQVWWSPLYDATPPAPLGPLVRSGQTWRRSYPGGTLAINLPGLHLRLPPSWSTLWSLTPDHAAPRTMPPARGR